MSATWETFERSGWDERVDPYHRFFAPIGRALAPKLLELAGVRSGTEVIDLCCGPGYIAQAASAAGAHALGLDISARMVALAQRLVPDGEFVVGDAAELPSPDRSADAVICNFGLHHLPQPPRAVAECGRVLRPGGRLVSTAWDEEINDLAIVPDAIYGAGPEVPDQIPAPPLQPSYLDDDEITALLAGSGLRLLGTDVIEIQPSFASADELWSGWLAAAIRTGPVLAAQNQEVRQRARKAFDDAVSTLVEPDGSVTTRIRVVAFVSERG